MNQLYYLATIFLVLISHGLMGQSTNIQFENIKTRNGLSAAHVNQVIQDKEHFLWIATANGLDRFDGQDFKTFRYNSKNNNSISGNNIRCLAEDSKGYIWVGTLNSGLNRYDYKTGKFTRFIHNSNNEKSISSNEILCLFEDSQGRLWVGTENGLNLFDYETNTFTSFMQDDNDKKSIKSRAILTIAEDNRGWIWIGTWNGGLNLAIPTKNPKRFEFRHFLRGDSDTDLKSNHVWKLFLDKENRLWMGMYDGGLSVLLPNNEKDPRKINPTFQTFFQEENNQICSNVIFGLNQDKLGQIWVATVDGLSVFIPTVIQKKGQTTYKITNSRNYKNNISNTYSLSNNEMRDVFIDKHDIIWCSTIGGVSKYDRNSTHFDHFEPQINSDINRGATAIIEYNDDIIYIAGHPEFGLVEYNQKTQATTSYYLDGQQFGTYKTGFTCFYKVDENNLWIGTRTGIVHFNPTTKTFKQYDLERDNGDFCQVKKIIRYKKDKFWLATNQGLICFDEKTLTPEYVEKDRNGRTFREIDISDILLEKNNLWLATYGGLAVLRFDDKDEFEYETYGNEVNNPRSICSNRIISLVRLNNEIWAGTENGLAKYRAKTNDFENYKSSAGLDIADIISMVIGGDNRLWLGTRQGLIVFNPQTNDVIHYDEQDGLKSSTFNINSVYRNQNGMLYFGSMNGYIRFKSESVKSNQYIPPIRITDITVFDKSSFWCKDVSILKEITLEPNEEYFTVEFAALNYIQPSNNQYAYKLEGFSDKWVNCGHKKSVSFSNLDGGTYTLHIKGSNNDGVWNEEGVKLKITIIPPIWKRLWFRILFGLLIVGLGFLTYSIRINQIERKKIRLEEEVLSRTQKIRTQKVQIETLFDELKNQNNHLEEIVKERTRTLERSNLELIRSNQDLEQFAYAASHDLQEPLRTIGSFTQLLGRKYNNKEDKQAVLYQAQVVDGVKRMSELIKSLLNYSRLGRNDIKFSMESPQDIINDKLTDLSLKIKEKNAEINIGSLPNEILCEPNQIGVVFYNLINNGLKFNTNPNPKITVQLEKEDSSYWTFSVTDNGIGIDEIYQDKVFEIFKRLNHVSKFEGTGIGLAFCKRILLRHEGDIWFKSVLNEGTTFYFTIHKHIKEVDE